MVSNKDGVHPSRTQRRRPVRVGDADVRELARRTGELRARDYRDGGGACHQAVRAQVAWGHELLRASMSGPVRDRLLTAVADLHNLAGWTSFDIGYPDRALAEYRCALEMVRGHGRHDLESNVRYRLGRVRLHGRAPDAALVEFARGRVAAERAGSDHAAAIVSVNQAWAHAMRGERADALRLLGRGQEEFARHRGRRPSWATFFDATDLTSIVGVVHTELAALADGTALDREVGRAVPALTEAVGADGFGVRMRRSRAFCRAMLAYDHVLAKDIDEGARVARDAVDDAEKLASARVVDRLRPLLTLIRRRPHPDLAEIGMRIGRLVSAARRQLPRPGPL